MGTERLSLWNSIAELLYKARRDCKCTHVVVHVILLTSPQEEGAIHTRSWLTSLPNITQLVRNKGQISTQAVHLRSSGPESRLPLELNGAMGARQALIFFIRL